MFNCVTQAKQKANLDQNLTGLKGWREKYKENKKTNQAKEYEQKYQSEREYGIWYQQKYLDDSSAHFCKWWRNGLNGQRARSNCSSQLNPKCVGHTAVYNSQ